MKINIIETGSTGNAILFDDIMVDAGLSYKKLSHLEINCVLLTHIHSDHFNIATIRNLFINNENIKFCCGDFLVRHLVGIPEKNIIIIKSGQEYYFNKIKFTPITLYHDVENFGYRLRKGEYRHIHATDTFSLDGISAKNYNSATIECNHDIDTVNEIILDCIKNGEFTHLKRAVKTHLNVDKTIKFIHDNNIKRLYPIHIGSSTRKEVFDKLINSNVNIGQNNDK